MSSYSGVVKLIMRYGDLWMSKTGVAHFIRHGNHKKNIAIFGKSNLPGRPVRAQEWEACFKEWRRGNQFTCSSLRCLRGVCLFSVVVLFFSFLFSSLPLNSCEFALSPVFPDLGRRSLRHSDIRPWQIGFVIMRRKNKQA